MTEKFKSFLKVIFIVSIVATIGMFWYDQINYYLYYNDDYYGINCLEYDNIALIKVQGEIVTYGDFYDHEEETYYDLASSERIVEQIEDADKRGQIKAIIIEIDSYGGSPVASEEIMNSLKRTAKPVIAVIRGDGVSGGYLVASAADLIYASEISNIGGIGVTMSYLDYSQSNKQEGLIYQELTSVKFKDTGSPDKELTLEERELLMRNINISHEIFIRKVAENRGLEIEKVKKLADGSEMKGEMAKENGLIDEIGDIYDAQEWIREKLNIIPGVCIF